jgi:phosphatidylserine/phosphatidylglycerophosphate/cardiolipin synthase-like enzyme
MRFLTSWLFLACILSGTTLHAQGVIINELFNSSGGDEWIELLVVQDSLDMRSWDVRDFSSGGTAQAPLDLTTHATWQNLRAGTIIVIARPENTGLQEDLDPSDYLLVIKSNNAAFFSGNVFSIAGGSDAVQVRTSSDQHVFGVSWGAANSGSLPMPKVHFSGSSSSGTSISFNEDSLPELTSTASWTLNNSTPTLGSGNTPTNIAWINTFRARADGSGTARIVPDTLNGGTIGPIQITYSRDTLYTITDLRIIVPPAFQWSHLTTDVSYTNMNATNTISGDTVYFNNITFSADSTVITIMNVTAPESTAIYPFLVQSRSNSYANVSPLPNIVVFGMPGPIAAVKLNDPSGVPQRLGELATIRGIVTVANQFGGPSYVQDNTGGIAIFGSTFSTAVTLGDEVVVTGVVSPFNGLSELVAPRLHVIASVGNPVTPLTVTCSQLFNDGAGGVEQFEGLLVRLNIVTVGDTFGNPIATWAVTGSGTNYRLFDATGHVDIRVDNDVSFANTPAPQGTFDVIGVVSQFKPSPPYIGGYQVMPRFTADIIATGPIFATFPVESNILPASLTIGWQTINNGTTHVRYGRTPLLELGVVGDDTLRTNHTIVLVGLDPGTVYYIQAFSVAGIDTSFASTLIASTASPVQSTGQINAYFNKSVYTNIAWFQPALGNQNLLSRLIPHVDNARRSIDAALYSLSGQPGDDIAAALVFAKNRGVKVRVICEYDNQNTNAFNTIISNGIPLITDRFDQINNGAGYHHNKFFVFDGRGGAPESVWVWTGSWNPTLPGTNDDYQNSVEVQDVALANAFTMEFNEMWGSSTDIPNAANSRFGGRKTDNTPHRFLIGGKEVECYFSPSDRTTSHIVSTIHAAQHSVGFALLTLTRTDIANAILGRKTAGLKVRGILDNSSDQGSQYNYLLSNGVDIRLKTGSGLLHHKYGIIDAEYPYWNSVTITGSHNWSSSAENVNNENTVLIKDGNITNQFLQEFAARYYQFGGTDTILVSVDRADANSPASYSLSQNYPNPFNPSTSIDYQLPKSDYTTLKIYDVIGREVATPVHGLQQPGRYRVTFTAAGLASGIYFYKLHAGQYVQQRKMLFLK